MKIVLRSGRKLEIADQIIDLIVKQLEDHSQWIIVKNDETGKIILIINADDISYII